MKKVEAVIRPERLARVAAELETAGFLGFTITDVRGHGQSPEKVGEWRGQSYEVHVTHKLAIDVFVEDGEVEKAAQAIARGAWTGKLGDGLISVTDVMSVVQIRSMSKPNGAKATT